MQYVAKVRLRLLLGGIGPEEKGNALPRVTATVVEREIGDQRLHPRRVEGDAEITPRELERPEEPDAEGWPVHASNIRRLGSRRQGGSWCLACRTGTA